MAKRSKSKFTDLVKFIPDSDELMQEENNEIRTNSLDDKYGDSYDEYDEYDEYDAYDEYSDNTEVKDEIQEDIPEEELVVEEAIEEIEEVEDVEEVVEEIEEIYEEPEKVYEIEEPEDIIEEELEDDIENENIELDISELTNYTKQNTAYKEEKTMKREVPDFVKEDNVDVQKTQQVGAQRYHQAVNASSAPENMKESVILGNTTIKGDIITDTGIQIYGAVIGNIESGGRVQLMGKVEGDISGQSVVITNTSLNGNIHADNDVTVKSGCVVNGDVSGSKIVLNGTIKGNIDADGQVDFEAGSVIEGNVSARSFNIRPGARINGSISTK